MPTFTIELPATIEVELGRETGLKNIVPIGKMDADIIKKAAIAGFYGTLNNMSRGWADDDKKVPNTDEVWLAARDKKIDGWLRGDWAVAERGDSNMALVKDQYYFETMASTGMSTRLIDKAVKDTVSRVMGKDAKATFDNFIKSTAREALGDKADDKAVLDLAAQIESAIKERAEARAASAKKASDKIVMPDLTALLGK